MIPVRNAAGTSRSEPRRGGGGAPPPPPRGRLLPAGAAETLARADHHGSGRLLVGHRREDVLLLLLVRWIRLGAAQLVQQVARGVLVDLDDPGRGSLILRDRLSEVRRRFLELRIRRTRGVHVLGPGRLRFRRALIGRHTRERLLERLVLRHGLSERLVHRLERRGVVPRALVLVVPLQLVPIRHGRDLVVFGGRDRHDRLGLRTDAHVLIVGILDPGGLLRLIPLDVLDGGEELVEVLEQVVALALVGH